MTDVSYVPPPPPPPPPPSAPVPGTSFDFGRPFAYVFEDPEWIRKVLIGGLVNLAGIFIVGWFFLFGYLAALARNVVAEKQYPLPDWDDFGDYFAEGLRLFGVMLCWIVPIVVLAMAFGIPGMILTSIDNEGANVVGSGMMGCLSCLFVPIMLAVVFFLPASLLYAALEQRFSAAFEWRRIWPFIKANIGNYLLAIVVYLIARFLAGLGVFAFCIGVIFTGFWAFTVTTYAFAEVYRLAKVR
jgi:hypothetical protein